MKNNIGGIVNQTASNEQKQMSTSMIPCSPGMISGFWSTSFKASSSSAIRDSFLTATSCGLNPLTCATYIPID
jgi:hypothetical protein